MGCFEHLGMMVAKVFQIVGAGRMRASWAFLTILWHARSLVRPPANGSPVAESKGYARGNSHATNDSLFPLSGFFTRPRSFTTWRTERALSQRGAKGSR